MRRLPLRAILALLVLGATVPLACYAGWTVRRSWREQITFIDTQNVEQAHAVMVAVDQEVERTADALRLLSVLAPPEDPASISAAGSRLLPLHRGWRSVLVADPNGRVLASTRNPPSPEMLPADLLDVLAQAPKIAVSRIRVDPATAGHVITIAIPVVQHDRIAYLLAADVSSSIFSDVLRRQKGPEGGVITLLDRTPKIVARTLNEERYIGTSPAHDFEVRAQRMVEGAWRATLLEGTTAYSALSRSALTGWTVGVGRPAESVETPVRSSINKLIAAALFTLAIGLFAALLLGGGIVRGQLRAAAAARALAHGKPVSGFTSRIAETADLGAALKEAAEILELRLQERDEAQWELDRNRATLLDREQTARRAAEALNRLKDEFLATVSHELRTPLNAILGWVALMKTGALDEQRMAHALTVIDRNTRAQAQLIEDLLDMSRVIRGEVRLSMHPVDAAAVLETAVETLKPTAAARHIEVLVQARAGVVVAADPARLQQILWNLLSNAIKFTPSGGALEASVAAEGEDAVITVSDNGEGIDPSFLPHVFDRFSQETGDAKRTHPGLGIGLSLVRHLTELHGGSVRADSAGKGKGAAFTVRLPLLGAARAQRLPQAAEQMPQSPGANPLDGLRILALVDDADSRTLLETVLQRAGARVTLADSGTTALDLLRGNIIDVIVADVTTPDGNGLARAVRAQPQAAKIRLVAVAAGTLPDQRDARAADVFDAHVSKPIDPATLVAAIAACVGRPSIEGSAT